MPMNIALTALQASIAKIEDNNNIPEELRQEIADNLNDFQHAAADFHDNVKEVLGDLEDAMGLAQHEVDLDNTVGTMGEGLEEILQAVTKAFDVTV